MTPVLDSSAGALQVSQPGCASSETLCQPRALRVEVAATRNEGIS